MGPALAENAATGQQDGLLAAEWRAEVSASHGKARVAQAERLMREKELWPWEG